MALDYQDSNNSNNSKAFTKNNNNNEVVGGDFSLSSDSYGSEDNCNADNHHRSINRHKLKEILPPSATFKNNNISLASNFRLSMFFSGNISSPSLVLYDENVTLIVPRENLTFNQGLREFEPTLLVIETKRLASDTTIIVHTLIKSSPFEPYYISASYDQGSINEYYPGLASLSKFHFPTIIRSTHALSFNAVVLIIASILSIVSFVVSMRYKRININWKKYYGYITKLTNVDILLAFPIVVLSSVLILYICEELPLSGLISSNVLKPPGDVTLSRFDSIITDFSGKMHQNDRVAYSLVFVFLSFISRSIIAFLIVKIVINKLKATPDRRVNDNTNNSTVSINLDKHQENKLFDLSFAIMGLPLWSIITLFFSSRVFYFVNPSSPFIIVVIIEVIRLSVLAFVIPRYMTKGRNKTNGNFQNNTLKAIRYTLSGVLTLSGIFNLIVVMSIFSSDGWYVWYLYNEIHQNTISVHILPLISLMAIIIIAIVQILWSRKIIQKWTKSVYYLGISGAAWVMILWSIGLAIILMDGKPLIDFLPQGTGGSASVFSMNFEFDMIPHNIFEFLKALNLVAMGIKIEVLMAVFIAITLIMINKENKVKRIEKDSIRIRKYTSDGKPIVNQGG
jgi:hypothetical protein